MAKLFLSLDGNPVKEFRLTRARTSIGRRPNNDIQIDNLAVSGQHAVVEVVGQIYFVEDLGSTNGTLLNGEKITRHPLKSGDELTIGKYSITFWREPAVAAKQEEFEKTMVMQAPAVPVASMATKPVKSAKPMPENAPVAVIRVLTGNNAGREMVLNKNVTSLGKAGLQVVAFTKRGNDFYITHVEGEQRPLVNSREISEKPQLLMEEDLIEVMGIRMAFFFR
ncbi:FHA domain-containing protein [Chitinibacter fontanus]|uniref:FHA domain-containing protein n=1 Tax=Chitinibacter fontanus TaxID=1737446 RepID=A0A7D5ZE64_9NEIS|nr:FHA domain-containing protein [Chitinibacter fontanus]QLI80227.1 FHA domain-containing protein [Chitinibacter fontanus]